MLNVEESIKDYLKKKAIYLRKTDFVLQSKLKFEIANSELICQVCGAETISGTWIVCIEKRNDLRQIYH